MNDENEVQYDLDGTPIQNDIMQMDRDELQDSVTQAIVDDVFKVEPEVSLEEFQELVTSMETLQAIQHTVKMKGVSKEDVLAFNEVASTIPFNETDFSLAASLEQYPVGYYTNDRSIVNVNYALESFSKTVVAAIKAVFQKLIEMVRSIVRFVRKDIAGEMSRNELESKVKALRKGKALLKDNIRIYGSPADLNKRMGEQAVGVLATKFKVNDMLMSFFGGARKSDIKLLLVTSKTAVTEVAGIALALNAIVDGKASAVNTLIDHGKLKRLEHSAKMATEIQQPLTVKEESWIRQYIYDNSFPSENIFEYIDMESISTHTPVVKLIDDFYLITDALEKASKKIQQYKADDLTANEDIRQINEYAGILSGYIGHVKTIMEFIIRYNELKKKLIVAIYNNDAMQASEIFRHARTNAIDGQIDATVSSAYDAMEKVYRVITN